MDEQKVNKEIEHLRNDINIQKLDRISRGSRLVSLIVIPVLFVLFTYGAISLNGLYQEIENIKVIKHVEQLKYETLKFENYVLEEKKYQLETELMSTYGLSIDSITSLSTKEVLEISLSANDAIKSIVRSYSPKNNVTVRYYKKTIDEKRVAVELEALGYKFVERSPSEYMSKKKTNAIWFGSGVQIEDTKIIALSLIRAGIPIKGIRPYRNSLTNPDYKRNIIEVGASTDLEDKPLLTVVNVKNAVGFRR